MMYSLRRKKNYILFFIMQIFSEICLRYVFINDYSRTATRRVWPRTIQSQEKGFQLSQKNTNRTLSSILRNFFTPFPIVKSLKIHDSDTLCISCTIFHILNLIINLLIIDNCRLIVKFNKDILNFSSKRFNFEVESSSINFEFLFPSLSRSNVRFTWDLWNSNSYCCVI